MKHRHRSGSTNHAARSDEAGSAACCPVIEFAHDGVEQIAQLEQSAVGAFLLGDHPINAGPKLVLALPRDPVSLNC
jgi:hypothetical protein